MFIAKIQNYDDFSGEANLIMSDGEYNLLCYTHPLKPLEVYQAKDYIDAFLCQNIVQSDVNNYHIDKDADAYFGYLVTAMVVSTKEQLVKIGGLKIRLDTPLPGDINNGDFVSFSVLRFDI